MGEKQCVKTECKEDSGVTCRPLRPGLVLPSRHGSAFKVLYYPDFVVMHPVKASTHHKKRTSLLPTNVPGFITSPVYQDIGEPLQGGVSRSEGPLSIFLS